MGNRASKSSKKKNLNNVILVDRQLFLSALKVTSEVLQVMGDEFESLRTATEMHPETRKALIQIIGIHLRNVAAISGSFQESMYDPIDPEGTRGRDVN